jgi:hypothetical protein
MTRGESSAALVATLTAPRLKVCRGQEHREKDYKSVPFHGASLWVSICQDSKSGKKRRIAAETGSKSCCQVVLPKDTSFRQKPESSLR